ncbi:MAG: xylulokinase, partial [Bryobacteraceae bacterium]
ARGGWIGLTARHKRADMIRAVIEGVCYSQKDGLEIIEQMGVPVRSVRLSGGGSHSSLWRQVLADVFNKRAVLLGSQEGSAYGAALLALVGSGAYSSVEEACSAAIREVESILPRPAEAQRYQQWHKTYQALYPALKPVYGMIT